MSRSIGRKESRTGTKGQMMLEKRRENNGVRGSKFGIAEIKQFYVNFPSIGMSG